MRNSRDSLANLSPESKQIYRQKPFDQSFPSKQWCCAVFKLKSSTLFQPLPDLVESMEELPRKNSQHLPILVSWVREGGGELVAFFVSLLQDVSFAGFDRKTLSQSCLLMKARCDSILSIFQPLINHSDSDWFPPSWFRIIIIISCPPFLQKVMIERDSPCKKKDTCDALFAGEKRLQFFRRCWGVWTFHRHHGAQLRSYEVALCGFFFQKRPWRCWFHFQELWFIDWLAELRFFVIKENPGCC